MSAKKYLDIRPKARPAGRVAADPAVARGRPAGRAAGRPLKARRRAARTRLAIILSVLLLALVGAAYWSLWQPWLRIERIDVSDAELSSLPEVVHAAVTNARCGTVPCNSIIFFSEGAIRSAVLSAYPQIAAVSVERTSLRTIAVNVIGRSTAFHWCGEQYAASAAPDCLDADAEGYLYQLSQLGVASTSDLVVYAPLAVSSAPLVDDSINAKIGQRIVGAEHIPGALQFARAMQALGAPVQAIQLRGDEADLYLASGTRLTYVLGEEQQAAALAQAAFPQLNLNDGSVDYVDLRFDGKVYLKKNSPAE